MSQTPVLDPVKDFEFVRLMLGDIKGRAYGKRQSEHAAALIAAVNSHAALLEALKNLLALVEGECPRLLEDDHHYMDAVNAIAQAEGRTS